MEEYVIARFPYQVLFHYNKRAIKQEVLFHHTRSDLKKGPEIDFTGTIN